MAPDGGAWSWLRARWGWFDRISSYDHSFLLIVGMVYFIQGTKEFAYLSISYYFKDYLRISPNRTQTLRTVGHLPWLVKPIYGLITDCFPIQGYHRRPYLLICGLLGTCAYTTLWLAPGTGASATLLIICFNVAAAMSDVVADAMVAERAKQHENGAGDIQSLCWACLAVGGTIGAASSGQLLQSISPREALGLYAMCPMILVLLVPWLDESTSRTGLRHLLSTSTKGDKAGAARRSWPFRPLSFGAVNASIVDAEPQLCSAAVDASLPKLHGKLALLPLSSMGAKECKQRAQACQDEGARGVVFTCAQLEDTDCEPRSQGVAAAAAARLAVPVVIMQMQTAAAPQGQLELLRDVKDVTLHFGSALRAHLALLSREVQRPRIYRPLLFLFLSTSLVPHLSDVMFFFYTSPTPNGAGFSSEYLSIVTVCGYGANLLGIVLYMTFLRSTPYRAIFGGAIALFALTSACDILLVTHMNRRLGISDSVFVMSGGLAGDVLHTLKSQIMVILATQLCPRGIEGTLFALIMSTNSLGFDTGLYIGAALCRALGVSQHNFQRLWLVILIRTLAFVATLGWLWLLPDGSEMSNGLSAKAAGDEPAAAAAEGAGAGAKPSGTRVLTPAAASSGAESQGGEYGATSGARR